MTKICRLADIVGIYLMGDALTYLLHRNKHLALWQKPDDRPSRYTRALQYLADHPVTSVVIAISEFVLGAVITTAAGSKGKQKV